jgi:hypothetical protein
MFKISSRAPSYHLDLSDEEIKKIAQIAIETPFDFESIKAVYFYFKRNIYNTIIILEYSTKLGLSPFRVIAMFEVEDEARRMDKITMDIKKLVVNIPSYNADKIVIKKDFNERNDWKHRQKFHRKKL